jgi:ElaB/YqjD/DUF883 family membrane-anchored ribosome-binding protein
MTEVKPGTVGGMGSAAAAASDHSLRDDLNALRDDLRRLKADVANTARHGAAQAAGKVGEAYDAAREKAGEAYDAAKDRASRAAKKVSGQIEDHPLAAVGIAFGAGLLLGVLLRSRD